MAHPKHSARSRVGFRTRFAPSPTGPLHLGHAYSAITAHDAARAQGGKFFLRIEDIDPTRCRPEYEEQIYDDLTWLGLTWERDVLKQSERQDVYADMLDGLWQHGFLYPCTCSRAQIKDAAGEGPLIGPDGIIYPGTCRAKPRPARRPTDQTLRLDLIRAIEFMDYNGSYFFESSTAFSADKPRLRKIGVPFITAQQSFGDVVLGRKDSGTSYHLAVVADDAEQKINHVIRGQDLFATTSVHVLLQRLFALPTPMYHHHRLIKDDEGKRLAKVSNSKAIATYRADGATPDDIRALVGLGGQSAIGAISSPSANDV